MFRHPPLPLSAVRLLIRGVLLLFLASTPLACGGGSGPGRAPAEPDFSVFVTGGLNSQLEPCGCHDRLGGHVRRATLFKNFAAEHPNARVLYLDAGQAFKMDSPEVSYAAPSMKEAMAVLHLDALNPGVYEVATGLAPLKAALADATFPVTSANLRNLDGNAPWFEPYLVLTPRPIGGGAAAGPRVGVMGFTVQARYSVIDGGDGRKAHFIDAPKAADEYLPVLGREAEAVIVIGNFGRGMARELASRPGRVDLVVGTDPHIQEEASDPGQAAPIYFTGLLGKRQLRFDFYRDTAPGKRWKVIGNITTIGDSLLPDPDGQDLLKRYSDAATAAGFGRGVSVRGVPTRGN